MVKKANYFQFNSLKQYKSLKKNREKEQNIKKKRDNVISEAVHIIGFVLKQNLKKEKIITYNC